ncbi:hypothetical protein G6F57_002704 [Rhizopus arrhizus]|uniref:Tc1-like transposase DDE domain-containing protein n=1 Tax=Rhizopus oryzae TaxID=64495 RepID=A0A9P7BW17_RHIOR|nr:hypothetical protein G6F23_003343 [Rhizopus arrhizus]KAG1411241.1 hypothetical protein G6F58_008664 [Rhizopus delemar]KAG0769702.1 hypothetical protein G6F24_000838 [Rhizopus arrhizus]KAG0790337.1 hypothetical protein G6F22_006441 [Rhizopus arrhizus]KAG0796459.1 hypothetical protein G6F21_001286 [Rhizopus arrhizus]
MAAVLNKLGLHNIYIVMDNATIHKTPKVFQAIRNHGHNALFLPPYSPMLNPIEECWAKIKKEVCKTPLKKNELIADRIEDAAKRLQQKNVGFPKEKRKQRRIIKLFQVNAYIDERLCPVYTFQLFRQRRPTCIATTLFVNSLQPNHLISTCSIQSWISKRTHLSTDEKRVSLRSSASSLTLQSDIPKDDLVAMGNWASSKTFKDNYRQEHL